MQSKKWTIWVLIIIATSSVVTLQGYFKLMEGKAFLKAMDGINEVEEVICIKTKNDVVYTYSGACLEDVKSALQVRFVFDKYERDVKDHSTGLYGSLFYQDEGQVVATAEIWELEENFAYDAAILPFITMVDGVPAVFKIENRFCKLNGNVFRFSDQNIRVQ